MAVQLLLLDDVDELGRIGDVVNVKPGYARNFLIPQKKAVVADKGTLRMQAKLQEERAKRAEADRREAEELVARLAGCELSITVKVDSEGHLYGSVTAADIVKLFEEKDVKIERKNVLLPHPIKNLGAHNISLKLKEDVVLPFVLQVESDIPLAIKAYEKKAKVEVSSEQTEETEQ